MIPPDLLTPLTSELGIGGIGGFCVGYAFKKITKILAALFAICFMGIQYLAYKGVITINYEALQEWVTDIIGEASALQGIAASLIAQSTFGIGFIGGLYLGLKKG